jgi:TRAP-type mannitol/chloroaromatic compound transport system substrate-binding protein
MANVSMLANYDAKNPAALKRLVASGAVLRPFPQDVMAACFEATKESCTEIAGKNPVFKAMYDSLMAYRADAYLWQQVSEATFDNFMMAQQRKKNL